VRATWSTSCWRGERKGSRAPRCGCFLLNVVVAVVVVVVDDDIYLLVVVDLELFLFLFVVALDGSKLPAQLHLLRGGCRFLDWNGALPTSGLTLACTVALPPPLSTLPPGKPAGTLSAG